MLETRMTNKGREMAEYWTRGQTCYGENDDRTLDRMTPGDNGTRIFDNLGSTMEP
jgi:hypothetical protein